MNATTSHPPPSGGGDTNDKCQLLGPFAVLVQAALGALALLSLVYKRWREKPQRPVKIWAFDASKQVFGSVLLHLANLFMSMFSAGEIQAAIARAAQRVDVAASAAGPGDKDSGGGGFHPNPCSFYLLNLAIDTTIGIPILILILKVLTVGAIKTPLANPPESIRSGHYGQPPRATWWLKQSVIYFVGLLLMKACVFFIFQLCPWIIVVGDWALRWTEGNTALQIAFVMLIFPLIMNAMQYYIIDTFIRGHSDEHAHDDSDASNEQDGLLADENHDDSGGPDGHSQKDTRTASKPYLTRKITPYDPSKDGAEPVESESSSRSTVSPGGSTPLERSRSPRNGMKA